VTRIGLRFNDWAATAATPEADAAALRKDFLAKRPAAVA